MIPRYPFTVTIEYHASRNRKPVVKHVETLQVAYAMYDENIGRSDVYRVTIQVAILVGMGKRPE